MVIVIQVIVWLCLAAIAIHLAWDKWREIKKERRARRDWEIDARRRSFHVVK